VDAEAEPEDGLEDVVLEVNFVVVDEAAALTPTQYESPAQKFVVQSEDTAGFQVRNCATVIPNAAATVEQLSPVTTSYHLLQVLIVPVCVGLLGLDKAVSEARRWSP
jgi:hypothetical protein